MNAIIGWTHLLRSGRLQESQLQRALESIDRGARSQAKLIEDLLDVSRIVAGRLRLTLRPVKIRTVVQAALDAIQPDAAASGVELSATLDADGPISADETRLQRAVSNILDNAVKFTPPGGRIDATLTRVGDEFVVRIRDTGRGIPRELLPRVCEPFWQAEDVKSRKRQGLGLGLAIVQSLIRQHGGSLDIDSPGVGMGATVTLTLPVLRDVAATPADR
jgi:signal transduction histidine kinase